MSAKTLSSKQKLIALEKIVFIGLCILLFYPPFFRGLFFERELFPTHILTFLLIALWSFVKLKDGEYKIIKSPVDVFAIGLVFMYFISIFYGVNTRLAIGEFLKYTNYFFVYLLVRDLVVDTKKQKWLLNVILLGGVGVAIVGIGSAIGTWNYNGAFVNNRISSTFQYPNTLASYLGALYVLALCLIITEERRKYKAIYGAVAGMFMFIFILTFSRGMWLMLPPMLLLAFIFMPSKKKIELITAMIATTVFSLPLSFLFSQNIVGQSYILWGIFIAAVAATAIGTYAGSLISDKLANISLKKLLAFIALGAIVLVSLMIYAINATEPLTLSNDTDKDKWSTVIRNIDDIVPNTEYRLSIDYTGEIKDEKPHAGRIVIYSIDEEGELERLDTFDIADMQINNIEIPFTTIDDTEGLKIYFRNYYSNTSITYGNAQVIEEKSGELIQNIPLKYKYIPESIVSRFQSISLKERNASTRFAFYKDAFKIVKDYSILGTGGGGWVTLYPMYQSYFYGSTQAHNYFLQVWIEVGAIGLFMLFGLLSAITYYAYKKYRTEKPVHEKVMLITIFTAIALIFAHALMDFDLSLSALTFVLWAFIGMLTTDLKPESQKKTRTKRINIQIIAIGIASLILIVNVTSLTMGNYYSEKGVKALDSKDFNSSKEYFEKAVSSDPYKVEYKADLASIYKTSYKYTHNANDIRKAKELMDEAVTLGTYDSRLKAVASSFYLSIGQIDRALELIEESVAVQPMRVENYIQKSEAYISAFNYYVTQKKDYDRAKEVINKAFKIKEQINDINSRALRPLKYREELVYNIGEIQFYYENLENNEYSIPEGHSLELAYYFDLDINNDDNIDMLRTTSAKSGEVKYEVMNEDNSFIRITNKGENYGFVYPYGLKLESDTEYKMFFKARGTATDNAFSFYVYDSKAEKQNQGSLKNIELENTWQIHELDIKTDSDIELGTQYLRFQHNGKDQGYIDVEEVVVFRKR